MRHLYLIRHGDAVAESVSPERPLSSRGISESGRLGRYFKQTGVVFDEIWHSPKLRAVGTAGILAELLSSKDRLSEKKGITPDDDPQKAVKLIESFFTPGREGFLAVVSHLPLIPELTAALVSAQGNGIPLYLPCAACLCLVRESYGPWMIKWLIEPAMLPE